MELKYWCVGLILLFFSCTKTASPDPPAPTLPDPVTPLPPNPPAAEGPVKSIITYMTGNRSKTIQKFSYDQNEMLTGIRTYTYDSLFNPYIDSVAVKIGDWQSGVPPLFYDVLYQNHWAPEGGLWEHHMLSYDNQNRIIRDSIADGNNSTNATTVVYTYDDVAGTVIGKNYAYQTWPSPSIQVHETDSFLIESENSTYDIRISALQINTQVSNVIFSTIPNPLYNEVFAKSLGIALVFHGYGNFRNKNMPTHSDFIDLSYNSWSFNFRWTTDAKGRVISGIGQASSRLDEYTYTY